jgi:hypothetical protein
MHAHPLGRDASAGSRQLSRSGFVSLTGERFLAAPNALAYLNFPFLSCPFVAFTKLAQLCEFHLIPRINRCQPKVRQFGSGLATARGGGSER